jgi:diguanylate cyclase (GGDEF)-like protein
MSSWSIRRRIVIASVAPVALAAASALVAGSRLFPEAPPAARSWLIAVAGGAVLVALVVSLLAARSATRGLGDLGDAVERLGRGELDVRYATRGPREVDRLGRHVNMIADQLEAVRDELERERDELKRRETGRTRELQQANRLLMDIANRDALTGLANRRRLELDLERHISLSRRTGVPVAVIMMDLDRFKPYNDAAGHLAGDTLLQSVARTLRGRARSTDLVVRWGGDEFCVLVPGTGPEGALALAEGFVEAIGRTAAALPLPEGTEPVGASAGVACFPGDGVDGTELIARADEALYRVKETGRGRVLRLDTT